MIDFWTNQTTGDDTQVVVWNLQTGEKVQIVSCAFHGPIGAVAWINTDGKCSGFVFGCADGSLHLYQRTDRNVYTIYFFLIS
jgi:WD40 repeat protein